MIWAPAKQQRQQREAAFVAVALPGGTAIARRKEIGAKSIPW